MIIHSNYKFSNVAANVARQVVKHYFIYFAITLLYPPPRQWLMTVVMLSEKLYFPSIHLIEQGLNIVPYIRYT